MPDLAKVIADEPGVKWIIGRVKAVTGDTFTMTYRGGDVVGVGTLDHYVPAVGDVVHVLSSDMNGMVAIGSNNQAAGVTPPTSPSPPVTVTASSTGTHRLSTAAWTPGVIRESPDEVGCWIYPSFGALPVGVPLPVARLTIRVTAVDSTPMEFVLHSMPATTGALALVPGASYRTVVLPIGIPVDVPLPLDWASQLLTGPALGVGIGNGDYTMSLVDTGGLLTFTPLM